MPASGRRRLPNSLAYSEVLDVWKNSRDAKPRVAGAPGIDAVGADIFCSRIEENIRHLRNDIQRSSFHFSSLRRAPVPKKSGGFRIIAMPTVRDRLLQRCLLRHLEADLKFPKPTDVSYGFAKGRRLVDAQARIRDLRNDYPWVLQVDIIKFFDNIHRQSIKALIRRFVRSKIISELLCSAVDCEIDDKIQRISIIARANGIRRGFGLRQGMPVSPALSNLILRNFDNDIQRLSIPCVRYADDIAIFSKSKNECKSYFYDVKHLLSKEGFEIPDIGDGDKTVISAPEEAVSILRVDVKRSGDSYKLFAPFKKIDAIKQEMQKIADLEECLKNKTDLAKLSKRMDSFVIGHGAALANVTDRDAFINRLQAEKRRCMTKFLRTLFGTSVVDDLSVKQLAILGLEPFPS